MNPNSIKNYINMGYNINNINLRVTYYSRVSTDHDEQKKSLINQIEYFEKMIKDNPNWEYVEGYIDEGISGTSDIKRNNFMKMITDAKQNKFDLILTKEISRFSRNTLDSIKYTRELLSYGVAVYFLNDNINTILPDSELRLTIMSSLAQEEIRRLSERVKFGMRKAQERGEILGNNQLYGYIKDKNQKKLIIQKDESKVVKEIYKMYVYDNLSLSKIRDYLNNKGILTRNKKNWSTTTIARMIKNPKYKGYYCGNKVEVINYMTKKIKYNDQKDWIIYKDKNIPAIVNELIWDKANTRINQNQIINRNTNSSIYQNKIYCENHNTLYQSKYFRRNKKERTWVCKEYLLNRKNKCNTANIRESELDFIIEDIQRKYEINLDELKELLINIYKKEGLKEKIIDEINTKEIKNKLKELIINKMTVKKQNKNTIYLKTYLNIKGILKKYKYLFKRGFDTKSTKRYIVNYIVEVFTIDN